VYKTARERLAAHANEPMCAGCHRITDPIDLAMEIVDTGAGLRQTENGAPIRTEGDFNGRKFQNTDQFIDLVRASPAVTACVVNRVLGYALGSQGAAGTDELRATAQKEFAGSGYRWRALLRSIAADKAFYQ